MEDYSVNTSEKQNSHTNPKSQYVTQGVNRAKASQEKSSGQNLGDCVSLIKFFTFFISQKKTIYLANYLRYYMQNTTYHLTQSSIKYC